jgi:hypothetical protein
MFVEELSYIFVPSRILVCPYPVTTPLSELLLTSVFLRVRTDPNSADLFVAEKWIPADPFLCIVQSDIKQSDLLPLLKLIPLDEFPIISQLEIRVDKSLLL